MSAPYALESEAVSLVLAGNFNPAIFQPAWLASVGLISSAEAEGAEVDIIAPQVSRFRIGPYSLDVDNEHLQLATEDVGAGPGLRDLALGAFSILKHTPIKAMGMNRGMHFKMKSSETWHQVGHAVVPKVMWSEILLEPGTRSVTVEGKRNGSPAAFVRVTLQPSARVQPGVFIATNEHFAGAPSDAMQFYLKHLETQWEDAQRSARGYAEFLLAKTTAST